METKYKIMIGAGVVLVSVAVGRFTAPVKTKIEIKTVEVIKEVKVETKDTKKKDDKTYTKTETIKPDGTKTSVTTIVDKDTTDTRIDTKTNATTTVSQDSTKETTSRGGRLNLSLLGGMTSITNSTPIWGAHVSKEVLGPMTLGIFGFTNGSGGVSIGINL